MCPSQVGLRSQKQRVECQMCVTHPIYQSRSRQEVPWKLKRRMEDGAAPVDESRIVDHR